MSKSLKLWTMSLLCLLLGMICTSCDDDSTKHDGEYAYRLIGTWQMSYTSNNSVNQIQYIFTQDTFTFSTVTYTSDFMEAKVVKIQGAWNVKKGVLQLNYDLESLTTEGMSREEVASIKDGFYKDNLLLADMNSNGEPYGSVITFGTEGSVETLQLSVFNGVFRRVN